MTAEELERRVLELTDAVEDFVWSLPNDDHRPGEAVDSTSGGTYCRGCELGQAAQVLRFAAQDYFGSRR